MKCFVIGWCDIRIRRRLLLALTLKRALDLALAIERRGGGGADASVNKVDIKVNKRIFND